MVRHVVEANGEGELCRNIHCLTGFIVVYINLFSCIVNVIDFSIKSQLTVQYFLKIKIAFLYIFC